MRLIQGNYEFKTIYARNPIDVAKDFVLAGARFLHVIDLDGAKLGEPVNQDLIIKLCRSVDISIQVGGGIREIAVIKKYLNSGISRVILGTKAIKDPDFLKEALKLFGWDKIVVALDVKNGKLMVDGWLKSAHEDLEYCLLRLKAVGLKNVMVTDVLRDGTLGKPNFRLVREVHDFGFEVIAAGGITREEDLKTLEKNSQAVVLGKALYEGKLDLGQLLFKSSVPGSSLTKRIIPCLDVKDGRVVKGVNFLNLKDAGDPVELAKFYANEGADELVFLDISASVEGRRTMIDIVGKVAKEIFIPFTVGGGVRNLRDITDLLNAGADKVAINTSAVLNPELITDAVKQFGSQCVMVAMDVKKIEDKWKVFMKGGRDETELEALEWAKKVEKLGAGEILLTSMDRDGTKDGFDLELLKIISTNLSIPVIASGGAGKMEDFRDVFQIGKADAALAASLFHFGEISIVKLKNFMNLSNIPTRL